MKRRIWELDMLRGFFMILIMLFHLWYDLVYLYGLTGMSFGGFVGTMLPLTAASAGLLVLCLAFLPGKKQAIEPLRKGKHY